MKSIFITGIGTGIGKTLVAAIVTEALQAAYWKPVQAGFADGTDRQWVEEMAGLLKGQGDIRIFPETYKLSLPASPHVSAREEGLEISLDRIASQYRDIGGQVPEDGYLVIEGAGGVLVPLNEREFVADLIQQLDATVLLVSRNYLGSINHSLLTAAHCKARGLKVAGWIFNDQFGNYETEIAGWTGLPVLASIPYAERLDREFIREQAERIGPALRKALEPLDFLS